MQLCMFLSICGTYLTGKGVDVGHTFEGTAGSQMRDPWNIKWYVKLQILMLPMLEASDIPSQLKY